VINQGADGAVDPEERCCAGTGGSSAMSMASCGGGDSPSWGGTAADGNSVMITVCGSFSQPAFALKQITTAAQAAVDQVNKDGGVNGKKIDLIACDDNGNPNGSTLHGRQAVQDKVSAVVGTSSHFGDNIVPQFEAANIPHMLPVAITPKGTTSKISFPAISAATPDPAVLLALKDQNCTSLAAG